jgi:hypothetical protein
LIRRDIDRDNLLPPLAVIQILGRYPNVPLSVVRECIYLRLHVLVPLLFSFSFCLYFCVFTNHRLINPSARGDWSRTTLPYRRTGGRLKQ